MAIFFIFAISNKNKKDKTIKDSNITKSGQIEKDGEDGFVNMENIGGFGNIDTVNNVLFTKQTANDRVSRVASRGKEMNAVTLVPGHDFLVEPSDESVEDVYAQIDDSIEDVVAQGFNTVIIDLRYYDSVIYQTEYFDPIKDADFLDYVSDRAKENGLYVYALYELMAVNNEGDIENVPVLDTKSSAQITEILGSFLDGRDLDGIILTDLDYPGADESFVEYTQNGLSMGYGNYLKEITKSTIKDAVETIYSVDETIDVGIIVDSVWASSETDEDGINTNSDYEQLVDGNVDTKSIIEDGFVDFVIVDTSSDDSDIETEQLVDWWGELTKENDLPLMMMYGEGQASEIAGDITISKLASTYMGTVFSSFSELLEYNSGNIDAILTAIGNVVSAEKPEEENEEVGTSSDVSSSFVSSEEDDDEIPVQIASEVESSSSKSGGKIIPVEVPLPKELKITNLESLVFTTEEPAVMIQGSSNPDEELFVNDKELERDKNGFFAYDAELKAGKNTFNFKQKDVTLTVVITQNIKILKDVTPVGDVAVEGDTKLSVTALSYEGANVSATLGNTEVELKKNDVIVEGLDKSSQFVMFTGEISIPESKTTVQDLGNVQVKAVWNDQTETMKGAKISVNKKAKQSDIGRLVQVTAELAETFPTDVVNDVSNSSYFPLPKGTIDHLASELITYTEGSNTFEYYNLASGNRVYAKDINILEGTALDPNNVSAVSVTNDGTYTYVSITNSWKTSFKMNVSGGNVNISLMDTASVPTSMPELTANPLFSSAVWSDKTLQLKMSSEAIFGVTPYYNNNTLVFKFTNPKASTSNKTVVVIDAGHGLKDPGAPGFSPGLDERELNQAVAERLVAKLQAQGISALLVPDSSRSSLQARIDYAVNNNASLFVSVHHNTSPNKNASGVEAYYFSDQSKALASNVAAGISNATGFINRGAKHSTYIVTKHQYFPAILAECGFLTNQEQYNKLIDPGYQDAIAKGITDGIVAFLNKSYLAAPVGVERSAPPTNNNNTSSIASPSTNNSSAAPSNGANPSPNSNIFDGYVPVTPESKPDYVPVDDGKWEDVPVS